MNPKNTELEKETSKSFQSFHYIELTLYKKCLYHFWHFYDVQIFVSYKIILKLSILFLVILTPQYIVGIFAHKYI